MREVKKLDQIIRSKARILPREAKPEFWSVLLQILVSLTPKPEFLTHTVAKTNNY